MKTSQPIYPEYFVFLSNEFNLNIDNLNSIIFKTKPLKQR